MARPKKTLQQAKKQLPKDYIDNIISLYSEGASDAEIFLYLYENLGTFSLDLWNRWINEEKEFSKIIKLGRYLSQGNWEKHGRTNIYNKEFNSTLFYMNMKNRFGWSDNQNIKHSGTIEHVGIIRTPEKKQLDAPDDNIVIKEAITEEL
jgi:hypothetical protein